jgi:hypothetical protein
MALGQTSLLRRSWYVRSIAEFQRTPENQVVAELVLQGSRFFSISQPDRDAWFEEVSLLRQCLADHTGMLYLEFTIPRIGHRVDAIVLISGIVLVLEFKVGTREYHRSDIDQVYDYAIDLKYFHEGSHGLSVVPVLVATRAKEFPRNLIPQPRVHGLFEPICTNAADLRSTIAETISQIPEQRVDAAIWETSSYCPTPTIIEAARALYARHGVADISRSDAGATNLRKTSEQLSRIIEESRSSRRKAICFVTGVPGSGKTLVGLDIATKHNDPMSELHSVYLSGNGPLVAVLREALARDSVRRERMQGRKLRKGDAERQVKAFIQNVHHFRDEGLRDLLRPPVDHVVLFDEAQRAWDKEQTAAFMRRKRGQSGFNLSEPEFLISCMDRRRDWAVIICLVGGGQEINTGEAGIGEWIEAVQRSFRDWHLYISPELSDSEYGAGPISEIVRNRGKVHDVPELHLSVSMRSFRAEKVSAFVKTVLDCEVGYARDILRELNGRYPIVLTRNLEVARQWLREQASGSERYGIVVSSQAERLKPFAIDVRTPVDPVKWFLEGKDDVRSSLYLEDVATEFHVQGLELDWVCVSWDGDFRYHDHGWQQFSFRGTQWQQIRKPERRIYLKNAYRVLLTRARQGMVIFIPEGSSTDPTRDPSYYDPTYAYLRSVGLPEL